MSVALIVALNANNILFFTRVRAVYGKSLRITALFGFCYMTVFGTSLSVPFALHAEETKVPYWIAAVMLCNAANDTLVFLAISYRITSHSIGNQGWRPTFRRFFRGDGVPRVAKDLLYNGQLCYFATIFVSVAQIFLALRFRNYTSTLSIPVLALENAMTCRVHRAVILGLIKDGRRRSSPFVLTTILTSNDTTLKEYGLGTKDDAEHEVRAA
ncbi:hypothetical protein HWV62_16410 [Athelia sp. TMB]|nr:hypothetical protein HWV62_16410 [Athelia sp. TMB]